MKVRVKTAYDRHKHTFNLTAPMKCWSRQGTKRTTLKRGSPSGSSLHTADAAMLQHSENDREGHYAVPRAAA